MLGYVTIEKGELKVREYEVYRGYYCGICKSIARRCGQLPRMTLSYDAVFLALILAGLSEEGKEGEEEYEAQRCIVHPVEKRPVLLHSKAVDYAADVMAILAYHKFLDDWKDEGGAAAFAGKTALYPAYRKLRKRHGEICRAVEKALERLSLLESEKSPSLDATCGAFAELMEVLFTGYFAEKAGEAGKAGEAEKAGRTEDNSRTGKAVQAESTGRAEDNSEAEKTGEAEKIRRAEKNRQKEESGRGKRQSSGQQRVLAELGKSLGRWIYAVDALDDYEKDKKDGSYNPLIYRKNGLEGIEDILYNYLAETAKACDLLELKKHREIIENIIFMGLRRRTDLVLKERTSTDE